MIDPEALLSVRIVEDVVTSSGEVLGTKVREDVFATESETVFPLQAALGYDITQTLFVGKNVLLVEGPSDFLYLKWFSSELQHQNREGLDRRWVITPSGGIDKIASFVALFGGNEINIAVITDFHSGLKGKIKSLTELYRLIGVFTVNSYLGQAEADIEDLLGREFYFALVNRCYNLSDEYTLNPKKEPKNLRVVKEVEEHFRTLPPDFPEFDHYTPAAYLVENGKDLRNELPGLNCALDRFEQLFKDLNKLLR
jgi:predicted ATP-dependent endonuclease of OLD family